MNEVNGNKENSPAETCPAHLYLVDDYGDSERTLRCISESGHTAHHECEWDVGTNERPNMVLVRWERDQSVRCARHGRVKSHNGTCMACEHMAFMDVEEREMLSWQRCFECDSKVYTRDLVRGNDGLRCGHCFELLEPQ